MEIISYLHTAILVEDLSVAEFFYGQVLGLTRVDRPLGFPGAWYQIGAVQIHLIVADRPITDQIGTQKWGRNRHMAFGVTDLAAAQAKLSAHQCPVQMSASGRLALFTQDPDGNIIELSQINS